MLVGLGRGEIQERLQRPVTHVSFVLCMLCPGSLGPFLNQHSPCPFLRPWHVTLITFSHPLPTSFYVGCDPLLSGASEVAAHSCGIWWPHPLDLAFKMGTLSTVFPSRSCSLLLKPWASPPSRPSRLRTYISLITSRLVIATKVPRTGDIPGRVLMCLNPQLFPSVIL